MLNKFFKNKKIIATLVIVFITIGMLSMFIITKKRNSQQTEIKTVTKDTSFDGQIRDFNDIYKKTLLAINNKQKNEAKKGIQEVLAYWLKIEKNFSKNKPPEYITTNDWEEKINSISELNNLAKTLLDRGDYEGAYKQLEKVRQEIKKLREENRIKNISNNFLSLNNEVDKITATQNKEEAIKLLPFLKISFVEVKEFYPNNQEYQTMLIKFAEIISDIENSSETTYKKNRDRLKPAFLEIYLQFG